MNVLDKIWATVREELSDIPDPTYATRLILRLMIAAVLGGILGFEREASGKSAGMRTHMLVCIGAALFILVPQQAGADAGDMTRVFQGLVAGIGFLGAGAILKRQDKDEVLGLTTAANIWMTAAIGAGVGMGREMTAIISTALTLIVLTVIPRIAKPFQSKKKPPQEPGQSNDTKTMEHLPAE